MKINKILSVIKKSTSIILFQDIENNVQLLSNGAAAYDISSLPKISTESELAGMLGIDDMSKHAFNIQPVPSVISDAGFADATSTDIFFGLSICLGGEEFSLVDGGNVFYAYKSKHLSPFESEDLLYLTRQGILLAGGLTVTGYIMPYSVRKDDMAAIKALASKGLWGQIHET